MGQQKIEVVIGGSNAESVKAIQGTIAGLKAMQAEVGRTNAATSSVGGGFTGLAISAGSAIYVLNQLKGLFDRLTQPAFQFSKNLETAQYGMAGILISMGRIDGKAMSFNQAMGISADVIKRLNDEALRTAATSEELVGAYQALLAPGLAAKMTLDQIINLTVVGVNAVKSMGLEQRQVIQELRDLVSGGIQPASSQLATSLGLKDSDIQRARDSAEGLYAFLMDRLRGFEAVSGKFGDTMQGRIDQFKEGATRVMAEGLTPVFAAFGAVLAEISGKFITIDQTTKQVRLNQELINEIRSIAVDVVDVGNNLYEWGKTVASGVYRALRALGPVFQFIRDYAQEILVILLAWKTALMMQAQWAALQAVIQATGGILTGTEVIMARLAGAMATFTAVAPWLAVATAVGLIASASYDVWKNWRGAKEEAEAFARIQRDNISKMGSFGALLNVATPAAVVQWMKDAQRTGYSQQQFPQLSGDGMNKPAEFTIKEGVNMNIDAMFSKKLTQAIALINEQLPGRSVQITDALRAGDAGGHGRGTKADIWVEGFDQPEVAEVIKKVFLQVGLEVIDEIHGPAREDMRGVWGPHLDVGLPGSNQNVTGAYPAVNQQQLEKLASAREKAAKQAAEEEYDTTKRGLDRLMRVEQTSYDDRLTGVKEFYAMKNEIDQRDLDAQIRRKRQELAATQEKGKAFVDKDDILANQAEQAKLRADIKALQAEKLAKSWQNTREQIVAERAVTEEFAAIKAALDEALGKTADATTFRITEQYRKLREVAVAMGRMDVVANIDKIVSIGTAKANYDELLNKVDVLKAKMQNEILPVQQAIDSGVLDEVTGRQRVADITAKYANLIKALIPDLEKWAELTGDPKLIAAVKNLGIETTNNAKKTNVALKTIGDSFRSGFEDAFVVIITQTKNVSEAFRNMANAILADIARMISKKWATSIVSSILPGYAFGGLVVGPGTGTSDSVPIRASAGEYIITAEKVRQFGVGFFDAINGGVPSVAPRTGYASGGLVAAGAGAGLSINVPISISDDSIGNRFISRLRGEIEDTARRVIRSEAGGS